MSTLNNITSLPNVAKYLTPVDTAISEITKRRSDKTLIKKVTGLLKGDIPEHFLQEKPILYLSRHIATPNFETLHFIEKATAYNLPIVIGEDPTDKFVSNNCLKKALGKLPIITAEDKNGNPITEHLTVLNFNENLGKPLNEVTTTACTHLVNLHKKLCSELIDPSVQICDESAWVRRNHGTSLTNYYLNFLLLFIVHGIMFEFYAEEDNEFVDTILKETFEITESLTGYKPLICELITPEMEMEKNWIAYPAKAKTITETFMHGQHAITHKV